MITCKPGDVAQIEIIGHFGFSVQLQYHQHVGHLNWPGKSSALDRCGTLTLGVGIEVLIHVRRCYLVGCQWSQGL
jgi:hypothetical protein